jgi:hypothetical protein
MTPHILEQKRHCGPKDPPRGVDALLADEGSSPVDGVQRRRKASLSDRANADISYFGSLKFDALKAKHHVPRGLQCLSHKYRDFRLWVDTRDRPNLVRDGL